MLADPFEVGETQACKTQRFHGVGVARSASEFTQHHEARESFPVVMIALAAIKVPDLGHHADRRLRSQSRYQFLPSNADCAATVKLGVDLGDVVLERRHFIDKARELRTLVDQFLPLLLGKIATLSRLLHRMIDEAANKSALTVGLDVGGKPSRALSAIGEADELATIERQSMLCLVR